MKQHHYRITVEHLSDIDGQPVPLPATLQFEVGNHDDIFAVVERIRQRNDLPSASATAFAVGLKLFSEVMLENKSSPLFSAFIPHFGQFMKQLKKSN